MDDFLIRHDNFRTPLLYETLDTLRKGRQEYRLLEAFSFELGGFGSAVTIDVPAGFITDFASIPWGFRWLLPPHGPYSKAAVVHDYMYEFAPDFGWHRALCDLVFLNGMKVLKVPYLKSLTMYYTVRLFGHRNFGKKASELGYSSSSSGAQEMQARALR